MVVKYNITFVFFFLFFIEFAQANDSISFDVDITVQKDGSLSVSENVLIKLNEPGLKSGFERILPEKTWIEEEKKISVHSNEHKNITKILLAKLNGQPVGYEIVPTGGDIRHSEFGSNSIVRFGQKDKTYPPGSYHFEYRYVIAGQIGYHEKYEWLNWHVTRNQLSPTVNNVRLKVHLPYHIDLKQIKASAYQSIAIGASVDEPSPQYFDSHTFEFQAENVLRYKIGLEFPLNSFKSDYRRKTKFWESDYVKPELTNTQNLKEISVMSGSLIILLIIMTLILKKFNRIQLTEQTLFRELSPAVLAFYSRDRYSTEVFMSALIYLIQHKLLHIHYRNGSIELERKSGSNNVFPDMQQWISESFQSNKMISSALKKGHALSFPLLAKHHQRAIQKFNIFSLLPDKKITKPILWTVLTTLVIFIANLIMIESDMPREELLPLSLVTLFFLLGTIVFSIFFFNGGKLFILIFILVDVFLVNEFINMAGWNIMYFALALIIINLLFLYLLTGYSGVTKKSMKNSIELFRGKMLTDNTMIKTQDDYLFYLSYAYAFNIVPQWLSKNEHTKYQHNCPVNIDKRFWGNGDLQPLYKELEQLLNVK